MADKLTIQVAYDKESGQRGEAVGVMEEVMSEHDYDVSSFELVPCEVGDFEVRIDGEVVFTARKLGRVPRGGEVSDAIKARLSNDVGRWVRYNVFRFWEGGRCP